MRKWVIAGLVLTGWCVAATPAVQAEVKLHKLFRDDNMVLQRDMPVPVWGTAEPGEKVAVEFQGQKVEATTGADGKWTATLKALKTGEPATLTASGKNKVELRNVLVGEVWLCGGQSNMEWALTSTREGKTAIAASKNANIRLFDVPKTRSPEPKSEFAEAKPAGKGQRQFGRWLECDPDNVRNFSGVGYYFGRALQRDLNVPIGLINSSWGGTAAEPWTSKATLEKNPDLKGLKGSDLYNAMIVPLQPFAIRGVIWYQGESNAGNAKRYLPLFSAMIQNWRDDWKQGDFPFLFVQLAPYDNVKVAGQWAELRESQLLTLSKVKNTAMAVITDAGDAKDIHPQDKTPVGERLAVAAKALAYGQKVVYSGPVYESVAFQGDKATLKFTHVGGGLVAKGGALNGFTIAGKDGKFAKADAQIVENTVVVQSKEVTEPIAVRYGWANFPVVNLYNQEGLPATPFRTDGPASKK